MLGWFRRLLGRADPVDDADAEDPDDTDADDVAPAVLDLHTFQPRECADLVDEYIRASRAAGLTTVRIIHGKGKGVLRRTVHAVLAAHPDVAGYRLADGNWGATIVHMLGSNGAGSTSSS